MTNIMCNVFRTVLATTPQDLLAVVNLSANRIAPAHEGVELGIGDASIIKVLTEAYGRKDDQVKAQLKVGARYFYMFRSMSPIVFKNSILHFYIQKSFETLNA